MSTIRIITRTVATVFVNEIPTVDLEKVESVEDFPIPGSPVFDFTQLHEGVRVSFYQTEQELHLPPVDGATTPKTCPCCPGNPAMAYL